MIKEWLQDRASRSLYVPGKLNGVSWQIIPSALGQMLHDKDAEKARRVMQAMLQMDKIDIRALKQAHEGR